MATIGERLTALRENKSLTQAQVAEIIGVDRTSYAKYEANVNKPTRKLKELSNLFNVTTDYIMCLSDNPHGTPFAGQIPGQFLTFAGQKVKNEVPPPTDNIKIPIIASVKCGYGGLAYEYLDGYVPIDSSSMHGEIKAFRCYGDSMKDIGIFDGDVAVVRLQDDVENGELAIVLVNDEGMLKRVRKEKGVLMLESANPDYPPMIFTSDNEVKIIGRVMEIRRHL
jgi:repressor LexA